MPPPVSPAWNQGDWQRVESQLNVKFPSDYKDFIEVYGTGRISGYLTIVSPFEAAQEDTQFMMLKFINDVSYQINSYADDGLLDDPVPTFYPKPEGLLPFGSSTDHHEIFWRTKGQPDAWNIVVFTTNLFQFDGLPNTSMTKFILDLLEQRSPLSHKGILVSENLAKREYVPLP